VPLSPHNSRINQPQSECDRILCNSQNSGNFELRICPLSHVVLSSSLHSHWLSVVQKSSQKAARFLDISIDTVAVPTARTEVKRATSFRHILFYFHRSNPIMTRKSCRTLSDHTLLLQTADGAAHSGGSSSGCLPGTSSNGLKRLG
jgi:hypothetical protein